MDDYERFIQLHLSQLQKIPDHLWRALHYKLQAEVPSHTTDNSIFMK